MTTDIAFVLTGDPFRNARALKQVRALAEEGYSLLVLGLEGDALRPDLPAAVSVERMARPPGNGPAWFHAVHRSFRTRLRAVDARCYHASDLYALSSCSRAARRRPGASLTYDARELYTAVASVADRPLVRAFWRWVEYRHIRRADAVFTVSGAIADELSRRYRIDAPILLPNVPDPASQTSGPGLRMLLHGAHTNADTNAGIHTGKDDPIILHLGQMRSERGCDLLIRAFARMQHVRPGGADHARLVFLGYGPEEARLRQLAASTSASARIHFVPPVEPDRVHAAASDAAVGVTLLQDTCLNHRYALPNKLFDYVHAGVPVLASDLPEISRVVNGEGLGMTVRPDDLDAVARALRTMLSDHDRRRGWERPNHGRNRRRHADRRGRR